MIFHYGSIAEKVFLYSSFQLVDGVGYVFTFKLNEYLIPFCSVGSFKQNQFVASLPGFDYVAVNLEYSGVFSLA